MRFGFFVMIFRCSMALSAIVKIVLVMDMKNRLVGPVREWFSNLIVYSIFPPVLIILISIVDRMDYTKKNLHRFQ
jgi:hypothetical protein